MDKVNKGRRYTCRQVLHSNTVHLNVQLHELRRLGTVEKAGLTDQELNYLGKEVDKLEAVALRLSKLGQHLQKGL